MNEIRPITIDQPHRLHVRALSPADLAGLGWLEAHRRAFVLEHPDRSALSARPSSTDTAVECDHRLVGALFGRVRPYHLPAPTQPWARLGEPAQATEDVDAAPMTLWGSGAFWLDSLDARQIAHALAAGRKAVVQQRNLAMTASIVDAAGYEPFETRLSPEAYLQQVHARSINDDRLTLLLDNGWTMRGHIPGDETPRVVMVWDNRRR